jgi:S-DNA-T family DNA segregation ATPase FtsK/SpoIIIE
MNNVVRGVTSDTLITGTDEELAQDIDIHEIHVDTERNDQYTGYL